MQKDYLLGAVLSTWERHPDRSVSLPALRQAGRPEGGLEISRYANNASLALATNTRFPCRELEKTVRPRLLCRRPLALLQPLSPIARGEARVRAILLSPSKTRMSPFSCVSLSGGRTQARSARSYIGEWRIYPQHPRAPTEIGCGLLGRWAASPGVVWRPQIS